MRRFDTGSKRSVLQLQFHPNRAALMVMAELRRSAYLVGIDLSSGELDGTAAAKTRGIGVTCFTYSPDGKELCIGGADGVARVFTLDDLSCRSEIAVGGHTGVTSVAYSPVVTERSRWIAAAGNDLHLRELESGRINAAFDEGEYTAVAFSPDGKTVAVGYEHWFLGWSTSSAEEVFRHEILEGVDRVKYSPDGRRLAFAAGMFVVLCDAEGPVEPVLSLDSDKRSDGADLTFIPDSRHLLVAEGTPSVKLFDPMTGRLVREYDWGIGKVSAVAVSPDGTMAAAGGEKGQVVVWDLDG